MSPRPLQSTGRPGTPVIGTGFETGHATVVTGALRGRVTLLDPTDVVDEWSHDLEEMASKPADPYATDVPARVQRNDAQSGQAVAAGQDVTVTDHLVQLPWTRTEVAKGHLITVTRTTDPDLLGSVLQVVHVVVGTERFNRDVFCIRIS